MPKWDFTKTTNSTQYWGKVHASYAGDASAEYQAKAQGRAGQQWHMEIEPLYPFKYEDGFRSRSQNLPTPGMAPSEGSPLMGRIEAFNALLPNDLKIESDEDFKNLEGHIFFFNEEEREFKSRGRTSSKLDAWPVIMNDEFIAPDDVVTLTRNDSGASSGSSSGADAFAEAATALDGVEATSSALLKAIMGTGNSLLTGNKEVMTGVQDGSLVKLLEDKKLITVANGKIKKA